MYCNYLDFQEHSSIYFYLQAFTESNQMIHMNGLMYGNLQLNATLDVTGNAKPVVFYFFGIDAGTHSVSLSGHSFTVRGQK